MGLLLLVVSMALSTQADTITISNGVASYVALTGPGYFVAREPVTGLLTATRHGAFSLSRDGFLITSCGMIVQGFADRALTTIGDLHIDDNGEIPMDSFEIQTNGCIVVNLADGTSFVRGQILLQSFQNPNVLTQIWSEMLVWSAAAGPLPQPVPPGNSGTGSVLSGCFNQLLPKLTMSQCAGPPDTLSQGFLAATSIPTDLGIHGNGFFVLRRTNDNALFATRAGAFYIDGAGYVVHYSGLRLQGYTNSALAFIGDLQIDPPGLPLASDPSVAVGGFIIDPRGVIEENLCDGTSFVRGQLLLQSCSNPALLNRQSFDLYPIVANSSLWSPMAQPFTGNLGWVQWGAVELSHLDTNLLAVRSNLNFFGQEILMRTGLPTNLAINGSGFFTVRDPVANISYATRWGGFQLDSAGHLVTTNGLRLQGLNNAGLTQSGDITIDTVGALDSSLQMTNYIVNSLGDIYVVLSDGSWFVRGRILLQNYRNLQALRLAGPGIYSNLVAAAPVFTNGLSGYIQEGSIQSGALEQPASPPTLQLLPASGFHLSINGFSGGVVESSGDLRHWDAVSPIYAADINEAEYFDTSPATQKFYRVVMQIPKVGYSGTAASAGD